MQNVLIITIKFWGLQDDSEVAPLPGRYQTFVSWTGGIPRVSRILGGAYSC